MSDNELEWAIQTLKKIVKESDVKGQMHIDLTLATAQNRNQYLKALAIGRTSISEGIITEEQFKEKLGLL